MWVWRGWGSPSWLSCLMMAAKVEAGESGCPPDVQEFSEEEMKEEREHFKSVINAFLYYRSAIQGIW